MKKHFLFVALTAATGLMTSCSSDDDLTTSDSQASNTIAFSTNKKVNTPQSRSGETVTSLNKFYVTALNPDNSVFFDSETFNYSGGVFKSSTSHYWPTTGTLSFYAINEEGTKASDANNVPHYTYEDWEGETDLVAATAIAGEKQMPYPLTFKHLTSQVIIGAEAEDKTEELTYKLISVTMTAPSTGTYSFDIVTGGTGSWSIDNTKTTEYSYADALPMSFAQSATNKLDNCYWNILPTTDGKLYFKVQYQVYQNGRLITDYTGDKYKECIVENPNLQAGKIYTYNFLLTRSTDDVITFTTTISDWDDEGSTDETLYDPSLTYVTYTDGTTKTFTTTGSINGGSYGYPGTSMFGTQSTVKSIRLSNQVTTLQPYAFSLFTSMESIYIPSSVTNIGAGAFYHCTSLKSVDIPTGIKALPESLCEGCHSLEKVTFASDITSLGRGTFNNCWAIKNFTLPNTVTEIGYMSLSYCYNLETVTLSKNLASIGDEAFRGDKSLKSVNLSSDNTHYTVVDDVLYDIDKTQIIVIPAMKTGSLTIPSTVKSIPRYSAENSHLTSLTIPDGVELGEGAFDNADNLESIVFGANCKLGINAFRQNGTQKSESHLKSITFNGKVYIEGYAVFWGCINLVTITYNSLEAPEFNTSVITSTYNGWSSTTAKNAIGYNTRIAGTNMFYVPKDATYTESDIDKAKAVLFDSSYSGFTLSKTL